jgi:TRAP-type uncharacterized transport system substrate-binding protein
MAKYVSWCSLLEADTGMAVRVVPENNYIRRHQLVADGTMLLQGLGKSGMSDALEASAEEYMVKPPTGHQARIVWIHDVAYSGLFVRGDSPINSIYDFKPGIRWSVWSKAWSIMKVPTALLAWAKLKPEDAQWILSGASDHAVRAVAEGRADIVWYFPSAQIVYDAAAAPHGIKFIDMNSQADPEGAARFREFDPMYTFGIMRSGVTPEARGHWGTVGEKYEITSDKSDPELIYHLAKWLDQNWDRYKGADKANESMTLADLMQGLETTYVPCHDGLIKYLKEIGKWTPAHDRRQKQNIAIVTVWVNGYNDAIKQAEGKGMKIIPTNKDWVDFWNNYKKEKNLPTIAMHSSLTQDAPWVATLGVK